MKNFAAILAALGFATGCGLSPEPLPWSLLDRSEQRYAEAPEKPSRARELLDKEELTLQDVLALADALNPELAAERKNIDLATAAIWDAKLYPNPSLLAQMEEYRVRDGGFGESKRIAGLGIPIVVSGRIAAATGAAEKEREVAAARYVWRRREILSSVKQAFVSLLVARRTAELSKETRDVAKAFHDTTQTRFQAQAVPEMELLKAAVAFAKSELDLKSAEKELATSLKVLHAAMGDSDFPKEKFIGQLGSQFTSPALDALRGQVLASHPLLEAAAKRKDAAKLDLARLQAERWPDPQLELLGGVDVGDQTIVEAGISIPLPLFNRNQGKIAAAESRIQQAEFELQIARNDLLLRLTTAHRTFMVAQERVNVYQDTILPKADRALVQTNEGYRQGKFSYLDVLDAQRTLAEARIAQAATLADLNAAVIELEKLTGTRLEMTR